MEKKHTNFKINNYLREVYTELKKVSWPSREHTLQLTGVVIITSLVIGAYVGALDFVFSQLMRLILK